MGHGDARLDVIRVAVAGNISVIVNVINEASEACASGALAKFCIDGDCDRGRGPS